MTCLALTHFPASSRGPGRDALDNLSGEIYASTRAVLLDDRRLQDADIRRDIHVGTIQSQILSEHGQSAVTRSFAIALFGGKAGPRFTS